MTREQIGTGTLPFDMEWSKADTKIFNDVERHGWHVMIVAGDLWFAYTIGLYARFKRPEMVVFGLRKEDLHAVCNVYGEQIRDSQEPTPDGYLGTKAVLRPVDPKHIRDYLGTAHWFYQGREFPVLQLVWSDINGHFPWDEDCPATVRGAQPLLIV